MSVICSQTMSIDLSISISRKKGYLIRCNFEFAFLFDTHDMTRSRRCFMGSGVIIRVPSQSIKACRFYRIYQEM
jgi:hypothetical protein